MGSPHGLGFFATWCWVLRATVPRESENIGVPRARGCCLCASISEVTQHHCCYVFFIRSESLSLPLPKGQGNRTCLLKGRLPRNWQAGSQTAIVIQAGQGKEDLSRQELELELELRGKRCEGSLMRRLGQNIPAVATAWAKAQGQEPLPG